MSKEEQGIKGCSLKEHAKLNSYKGNKVHVFTNELTVSNGEPIIENEREKTYRIKDAFLFIISVNHAPLRIVNWYTNEPHKSNILANVKVFLSKNKV